ncbi:MAG TPA: NB-ARC domain-containing protein, partial [Candidatus Cybelea sp.]|nr:NB-ARC domain-containing protein [Candidatus Cybelea sp.]
PVAIGPRPAKAPDLPLALSRFVGRDAELAEIAALVKEHRFVTVTGAGGVGKTQTALRVASALRAAGESSIHFIALAPVSEPSLVATVISSALGVQEVPDRPLPETLIAFLKNKRALLLLDNCEHVVEEAAIVSQVLLRACAGLRILATSREALHTAGERTYRLPSLGADDAVALFVDRARAANAQFQIHEQNRPAITDICGRLDGIPLAIELAAARVNALPPAAIAAALDDCFRILGGGERTALPRQRTMRAAIDWSYGLLAASEQRLFERLSIFAGGCTLETATAVCSDEDVPEAKLLDLLSSIVEKSLIVADSRAAPIRFRLLEPFRQYAGEKLIARGEYELVAGRRAAAMLEVAQRLLAEWDTAEEPAWHQMLAAEIADWRGALDWTLGRRSDIATGQRLVAVLQLLTGSSAPTEWQRWVALARELAGADASAETLAELAYAECGLRSVFEQQELELTAALDALSRYRSLNDELGIIRSEFHVARASFSLGRHSEGEPILLDAISRARRLGLRKLLAVLLLELARSNRERGDVSLARRCITEARTILLSVGAALRAGLVAEELALCELYEGKPDVAAQHLSEALSIYRTIGDMRGATTALALRAICLCRAGDLDRAESSARESLAIATEHLGAVGVAIGLDRLAAIAAFRGANKSETSRDLCERSARLFGFVDAVLVANGSPRFPHDSKEYEDALALVRDRLGESAIGLLMREGATMTEDDAVAEALAR